MADEYRVLPYSDAHRDAVLALHNRLLPRTPKVTEQYFSWKYEQNPYLPAPLFSLVYAGEELVAMRGLCGSKWISTDGSAQVVPTAEDLIIDDAHRNRGLFLLIDRTLAAMAAELGFETIFSLSGNAATRQLQGVVGWKPIGVFEAAVRPALPRGPVAGIDIVRKAGAKATATARRFGIDAPEAIVSMRANRMLTGIGKASPHLEVTTTPDIAAMVEMAARRTGALHHQRDEVFYGWRLRNPDRRYRFVFWDDAATQGFLTLAFQPDNPGRLLIVDGGATTPEATTALLDAVAAAARPPLTVPPKTLPADAAARLASLGFELDTGEPIIAVYARSTSGRGAGPMSDELELQLIDTMLG